MTTIGERMAQAPERFELRQLVRILRLVSGRMPQLAAAPALEHPRGEVSALLGGDALVLSAINALVGPTGVMPNTERHVAAMEALADAEARDGLPLLQLVEHCLGAIGHDMWEASVHWVAEERGEPGILSVALLALAGRGVAGAGWVAEGPDLRGHLALLYPLNRNHLGLADALGRVLGVAAQAEPLHGRWQVAPAGVPMRLGRGSLGQATLGRFIWDRASALVVQLSDVPPALAEGLLDDDRSSPMRRLAGDVTQAVLQDGLAVRLEFALPPGLELRLSARREPGSVMGRKLGVHAWLGRSVGVAPSARVWID